MRQALGKRLGGLAGAASGLHRLRRTADDEAAAEMADGGPWGPAPVIEVRSCSRRTATATPPSARSAAPPTRSPVTPPAWTCWSNRATWSR